MARVMSFVMTVFILVPMIAPTLGQAILLFTGWRSIFGNLNSLAMEPLGHVAGVGAAVVGSLSTLISVLLGTMIGQSYNGTVLPLIAGLGILAVLSLFVSRWADAG